MQDHSRADQSYHVTASLVLDLAKRAFEIFQRSETLEKRSLINFVFQNMKLRDGKLVWELKEPFNIIVNYAAHPVWLPTLDALRRFDWGKLARDLQTVRGILGLEPVYG